MKKLFTVLALLCLVLTGSQAQKKFSVYGVAFYNQENLFDTCHDEGKNDVEFLPTGSYRWNGMKYTHKLRNMSRALAELGTDVQPGVGCTFIGLSEVENHKVLDALIAQEPLASVDINMCTLKVPTSVVSTVPCFTTPPSSPCAM